MRLSQEGAYKKYRYFEQFQAQPANKPALHTAIPRSGIV